jgi:outer membrane protein assembly factor BamB
VPTFYAFDASTGAQLFAAPVGAWPNTLANANIVPVVANGKVYVASYKRLDIFGLGAGAAVSVKSTAKSTVDVAPQFSNGALYGTIAEIKGSQLVITTKTGRSVQVDASAAVASKMSVPLFVGGHVAVTGTASGAGEVKAEAIRPRKTISQFMARQLTIGSSLQPGAVRSDCV